MLAIHFAIGIWEIATIFLFVFGGIVAIVYFLRRSRKKRQMTGDD